MTMPSIPSSGRFEFKISERKDEIPVLEFVRYLRYFSEKYITLVNHVHVSISRCLFMLEL